MVKLLATEAGYLRAGKGIAVKYKSSENKAGIAPLRITPGSLPLKWLAISTSTYPLAPEPHACRTMFTHIHMCKCISPCGSRRSTHTRTSSVKYPRGIYSHFPGEFFKNKIC